MLLSVEIEARLRAKLLKIGAQIEAISVVFGSKDFGTYIIDPGYIRASLLLVINDNLLEEIFSVSPFGCTTNIVFLSAVSKVPPEPFM